jgi:hypothetical protein
MEIMMGLGSMKQASDPQQQRQPDEREGNDVSQTDERCGEKHENVLQRAS